MHNSVRTMQSLLSEHGSDVGKKSENTDLWYLPDNTEAPSNDTDIDNVGGTGESTTIENGSLVHSKPSCHIGSKIAIGIRVGAIIRSDIVKDRFNVKLPTKTHAVDSPQN